MQMTISEFPQHIDNLTSEQKEIFDRIFRVRVAYADMHIPESMNEWITKQFGSVEKVHNHTIVRVDNLVTNKGSLYNALRTMRPQTAGEKVSDETLMEEAMKPPFNDVEGLTPSDVFGRIEGKYARTAANVAKYDGWHAVIVFDEPHPLKWSEEQLIDYVDVANRWFDAVFAQDAQAKYPIFLWNCLWRSSASIVHGHSQVLLAREYPYMYYPALVRDIESYTSGDYLEDYFAIHQNVGLAWEQGNVKVVVPLDQEKEREVQIWADAFDGSVAKVLYGILATYRDTLGVQSFNVVGYLPPMDRSDWQLPVMLRVVDRGNLANKGTEIGVMERFVRQHVIENDPFAVAEVLKN